MEFKKKNNNKYTAIIDCTEIFTERSSNDPLLNQELFSNYKNHYTLKYLVGIDENGLVIFCSNVYGGSNPDHFVVQHSQFIDLLTEGDAILADRGFNISDLLEEKKIVLNIPPFKNGPQMDPVDILKTRAIASERIHVERVINLTKKFKILHSIVPAYLWPHINEIIFNINCLCNFKGRVIQKKF